MKKNLNLLAKLTLVTFICSMSHKIYAMEEDIQVKYDQLRRCQEDLTAKQQERNRLMQDINSVIDGTRDVIGYSGVPIEKGDKIVIAREPILAPIDNLQEHMEQNSGLKNLMVKLEQVEHNIELLNASIKSYEEVIDKIIKR